MGACGAGLPAESIIIEKLDFKAYDESTNNNPKHWRLDVFTIKGTTKSARYAYGTTFGLGRSTWIEMTYDTESFVIPAGETYLLLDAIAANTPGTCYFTASIAFRFVAA